MAGYFLDEVLYRQPPELVISFGHLILDELSVPACNALCGQGSAVLLEQLYRANLFVTCVDDEAVTYRYHQLIKEVLRAQLHRNDAAVERRLHDRRPATWPTLVRWALRHGISWPPAITTALLPDSRTAHPRLRGQPQDRQLLGPRRDPTELFADSPELLVALTVDLQLEEGSSGAGVPGAGQEGRHRPAEQPELAVQLAAVNAIPGQTGQLQGALDQRQWARRLEIGGGTVDPWFHALDVAGPTATPISVSSMRPVSWSTR